MTLTGPTRRGCSPSTRRAHRRQRRHSHPKRRRRHRAAHGWRTASNVLASVKDRGGNRGSATVTSSSTHAAGHQCRGAPAGANINDNTRDRPHVQRHAGVVTGSLKVKVKRHANRALHETRDSRTGRVTTALPEGITRVRAEILDTPATPAPPRPRSASTPSRPARSDARLRCEFGHAVVTVSYADSGSGIDPTRHAEGRRRRGERACSRRFPTPPRCALVTPLVDGPHTLQVSSRSRRKLHLALRVVTVDTALQQLAVSVRPNGTSSTLHASLRVTTDDATHRVDLDSLRLFSRGVTAEIDSLVCHEDGARSKQASFRRPRRSAT